MLNALISFRSSSNLKTFSTMSAGGRPPTALRRPSPELHFGEEDGSVTDTLDTLDYAVLPDYLLMANELMKQMNQKKRIKNPNGLASNIFIPLYEAVTKRRLSGKSPPIPCCSESLSVIKMKFLN